MYELADDWLPWECTKCVFRNKLWLVGHHKLCHCSLSLLHYKAALPAQPIDNCKRYIIHNVIAGPVWVSSLFKAKALTVLLFPFKRHGEAPGGRNQMMDFKNILLPSSQTCSPFSMCSIITFQDRCIWWGIKNYGADLVPELSQLRAY